LAGGEMGIPQQIHTDTPMCPTLHMTGKCTAPSLREMSHCYGVCQNGL